MDHLLPRNQCVRKFAEAPLIPNHPVSHAVIQKKAFVPPQTRPPSLVTPHVPPVQESDVIDGGFFTDNGVNEKGEEEEDEEDGEEQGEDEDLLMLEAVDPPSTDIVVTVETSDSLPVATTAKEGTLLIVSAVPVLTTKAGIIAATTSLSSDVTVEHLKQLYLKELQQLCDNLSINRSGRKNAVISRIVAHISTHQ